MALHGKFIVNNKPLSPLSIPGIGTFMAFSGNGAYRNRGGCTALKNDGPIPAGRYWIVDRPDGRIGSRIRTWATDAVTSTMRAPVNHREWFALYCDDSKIDDYAWVSGVERGNFRLHPNGGYGVSLGCITVQSNSDFRTIRRALMKTSTVRVHDTDLRAYGTIEVITHGSTCP